MNEIITKTEFSTFEKKFTALRSENHDSVSILFEILLHQTPETPLKSPQKKTLSRPHFTRFVQGIIDFHPGLALLRDTLEFQKRYMETVIERVFYRVNRSWSGELSLAEMRRSKFVKILGELCEEDINKSEDFYSYEHFYVIYCKFWELDTNHDLFLEPNDLLKYADFSLSFRIVSQIFSGAVSRAQNAHKTPHKISYQDFIWFLLSEEDKSSPTSIEYWFRCMDLDGDGVLSMYELEYFYEEQLYRMENMAIETISFQDSVCQVFDMIHPRFENKITLHDLKKSHLSPVFFNMFLNLAKFLDFEQKDPFLSKKLDLQNAGFLSDWHRFAHYEYQNFVQDT